MQDSSYLSEIEVSETSQQLPKLRDMMLRNNQTGFEFLATTRSRFLRVSFKDLMNNIARIEVLTPRSNVKQIRVSYFDDFKQTIKESTLQDWPMNYISDFGKENNTLDKLCPNFLYRGIRVDILQTDSSIAAPHNVSLKIYVRTCGGPGGRTRKFLLT